MKGKSEYKKKCLYTRNKRVGYALKNVPGNLQQFSKFLFVRFVYDLNKTWEVGISSDVS